MIGELASAIPAEGGFYVWVRRAMGPFWGFQEGWLSLSASVFDMAIYPAFVVSYLGKFDPNLTSGWHGYAWSLAVVALFDEKGKRMPMVSEAYHSFGKVGAGKRKLVAIVSRWFCP